MKYFLPDSQDLVDPSFDFERERRSESRQRQRDDLYAHEVFSTTAFDGILVSKGIVDGYGALGSRYTLAQRHRLLRLGAPEFLRVPRTSPAMPIMGDCGAFTYAKERAPPYTVEELLEFYDGCSFTHGLSLDHVIFGFTMSEEETPTDEMRRRQDLTLSLAEEFLDKHRSGKYRFEPLGVAQGWSPASYARAVGALQKMGYKYIALGGMVPLKSPEILASLRSIDVVRTSGTQLHLLGVTRTEHIREFARLGVASFDSTSPLRQAFKDAKDNYYTMDGGTFTAIRIPQVEGNPSLQRLIASGVVSQDAARRHERECLESMRLFEQGKRTVDEVVTVLDEYESFCDPEPAGAKRGSAPRKRKSHVEAYRATLSATPWRNCACDVCRDLGHHVVVFRGAERNRRRGFHNVWTFYRQLKRELGTDFQSAA